MRRSTLLLAAAAIVLAVPASAKPTFVKAAKDAKIEGITSCVACHKGVPKKGGEMTERGAWLIAQKASRKAAEVDVTWLKDYKGK